MQPTTFPLIELTTGADEMFFLERVSMAVEMLSVSWRMTISVKSAKIFFGRSLPQEFFSFWVHFQLVLLSLNLLCFYLSLQ